MINILIRHTRGRTDEFCRCLASIKEQVYKDVNLIVSIDGADESVALLALEVSGLKYEWFKPVSNGKAFGWNLHCNDLKAKVTNGWFFYLDDDDTLIDKWCLWQISTHLVYPYQAIICQFMRGARLKPRYTSAMIMKPEHVIRGKIGGSCIFLHCIHKDVANWDGAKAADYRFIKAVGAKLPLVYVPIPVVKAGNMGRKGK